jgi:23S rRNA pseudouridine2605 synthase
MEERIQKIIAQMGIASRRKAEEIIAEGRVTVNGKIALIGEKADASKDHIKVDGKLLIRREPKVYLMFNKPRNVVTSLADPQGRPTIKDYLKGIIDDNKINKLRQGVRLEDGRTLPAKVKFARQSENNSWIEIAITEGKKRQVRRMVEAIGHPALKLRRVSINGVRLSGLKIGELRPLTERELQELKKETGLTS